MVWIPKPVLELKMEGNADDSSGYDNHGIVTDAVLTDDRWGHPNSAYSFNGTSAFIDCGTPDSLNITDEITISEWIYVNGSHSSGFGGIYLGASSSNKRWLVKDDGSMLAQFEIGGISKSITSSVGSIPQNVFTHVILTYNGSEIVFWINGIKQTPVSASGILYSNEKNILGYGSTPTIYNFNGSIDVVHIYPVALSPTQVKYLYNKSKRNYGGLP